MTTKYIPRQVSVQLTVFNKSRQMTRIFEPISITNPLRCTVFCRARSRFRSDSVVFEHGADDEIQRKSIGMKLFSSNTTELVLLIDLRVCL